MCSLSNALVGAGDASTPAEHHLDVVRSLAARACQGATQAYCRPVHEGSAGLAQVADHTKCQQTERTLKKKNDELRVGDVTLSVNKLTAR